MIVELKGVNKLRMDLREIRATYVKTHKKPDKATLNKFDETLKRLDERAKRERAKSLHPID
jgi:hypothetical protein